MKKLIAVIFFILFLSGCATAKLGLIDNRELLGQKVMRNFITDYYIEKQKKEPNWEHLANYFSEFTIMMRVEKHGSISEWLASLDSGHIVASRYIAVKLLKDSIQFPYPNIVYYEVDVFYKKDFITKRHYILQRYAVLANAKINYIAVITEKEEQVNTW